MLFFQPGDFDREAGRKKLISFLRGLDVKVHELEQSVKRLKDQETYLKRDVADILKAGFEEED